MNSRTVDLPFAGGVMQWTLPPSWTVTAVPPPVASRTPAVREAVRDALETPLGTRRLRETARPGMRVTIAVPDVTRPCPNDLLVRALLDELARAGVGPEAVTVVFALGMHRRMRPDEVARALGDAAGRVTVLQSRGDEAEAFRDLGPLAPDEAGIPLPAPVPVHLHRSVVECDLLLATGVVEPHQYAGYSGTRKTVAVGCAGSETIRALHGVPFLDKSAPGVLADNAFHASIQAIARRVRLGFVLNVARTADGTFLAAGAGEPDAVLHHLVDALTPTVWLPVEGTPFDLVLAGVGAGKDQNLYQASRALTYLTFSPHPVIRPGGWIAVAAACPEGTGDGPGEREFVSLLRSGPDPAAVTASLARAGFGAGGQRAYMVARALCRYRGVMVGNRLEAGILPTAGGADEALARMDDLGSGTRVLVVPNALAVLPRPAAVPGP
jgi:nickel-dependent lactate racemase